MAETGLPFRGTVRSRQVRDRIGRDPARSGVGTHHSDEYTYRVVHSHGRVCEQAGTRVPANPLSPLPPAAPNP